MIEGKRSKIRVKIETGRTHQIRVHLKSIGASILGDTEYGGRPYKRLMLHASKIALLGYKFESKEPEDFIKFAAVWFGIETLKNTIKSLFINDNALLNIGKN